LFLWNSKRDEKGYYANKFLYEDVKKKKITKYDICSLFRKLREQNTLRTTTKWFPSIGAFNEDIKIFFVKKLWVVFDVSPYNNHEIPVHFLRNLYYDLLLREIPNYFVMLDSQGVHCLRDY
jgi:hypothetical protein